MNFKTKLRINSQISHYNHDKYWKMKNRLQNGSVGKIKIALYVYKMKKMEAFNCASFGTREDGGSFFEGIPHFPHGIKGIFISDYVRIGKEATFFQQVTIGIKDYDHGLDKVPTLGDNVTVGAGAKVLGHIKIGNNVTIGANAVVTKDVPDNAVVVGNPGKIIKYKEENK